MKMSPCCSRRSVKVAEARGYLRRLAQRAAYHAGQGRDITSLKEQIAEAKAQVAFQEQARIDHEAEHAGQAVPA